MPNKDTTIPPPSEDVLAKEQSLPLEPERSLTDLSQSVTGTDMPYSASGEKKDEVGEDQTNVTSAEVLPGYQEASITPLRLSLIIGSMSVGLFLSLLDTSIVATALYTIGRDFDALDTVNWVALAYTLSYVGLAVIFASLGDVFGRRNAFVAASIIFVAFSLGCGFAQSMNQLIALRTFQGLGGAGLYSLTMVIFPEITPLRLMKWIGGIIGAVVAVAGVMGPVLGGIITNYTTWRWVFWINGPVGLLSIIPFFLAWPPADQLKPHVRRSLRQVDFVGCLFLIAASVLVVFSFQEGGIHKDGWSRALFIAPIIIGIILWVGLIGWEWVVDRKWHDNMSSIFPLRLLKNRVYLSAMIATMLMGYPYFTAIYTLPIRFQVVHGKSVLIAGVALLPMLGSSAVGSMLGGAFSSKKNNTFYVLFVGQIFMLIGSALLSTLSDSVPIQPRTYGFEVFVGMGFGLTVSTVSILANIESQVRDHAVSQGIIAQMRVLGGSIGIAASTAILGVNQRSHLSGIVSESQLTTLSSTGGNLTLAQWAAIRKAYSDAFSETLLVAAIISGACVLVTIGTFRRHREDILEIRKRQFAEEAIRQQDALAGANAVAIAPKEQKEDQTTSVPNPHTNITA